MKLIDVYPYRYAQSPQQGNEVEFLLLHRAPGKIYEGRWRMVGGKVEPGESRPEAALRELREELGMDAHRVWAIPSVNQFYDHKQDQFHLVAAFAAEMPGDGTIRLNHEHNEMRWVSASEAARLLIWPEQIKMIAYISALLSKGDVPREWFIYEHPAP